jgi:anti-sigma factor RsiW
MSDCPNAEIRDLLPDLLHGRLDAASRDRVESHVRGCESCRRELALLRQVRHAAPQVTIDVNRIVAALPPAGRRRAAWRAHVWQMAAAVVFLAVGGSAVARYVTHATRSDSARPGAVASNGDTSANTNDVELSVGYGYTDLTDAQLQTLLKDVEQITALPMTDPDVSLPNVTVNNGGA